MARSSDSFGVTLGKSVSQFVHHECAGKGWMKRLECPPPPWGSRLGKDSELERDQGLLRVGLQWRPRWVGTGQAGVRAGGE